jgi:putative oxidoreductase
MAETALQKGRARALAIAKRVEFLPLFMLRLDMGLVFAFSGWGKLHSLDKVAKFFADLGIPAPAAQAMFIACLELVGGVCLILGIGTRAFAGLLACTMVVAMKTAILPGFKTDDGLAAAWNGADGAGHHSGAWLVAYVSKLAATDEFTYMLVLGAILILGPGRAAIDRFLARKIDPNEA